MSPKPATMSAQQARDLADFLLADLRMEIPTTIRVLEAVPVDKLDYAPDPKSKNALALVRHIVVDDLWFLNGIANASFAGGNNDQSDACGIMTPADGAAKYKELVPAAVARVAALPDAKLAEELDFFGMMKLPAVTFLSLMAKHPSTTAASSAPISAPWAAKSPASTGPAATASNP